MKVFALKHVATGELMPEMKRGKGYCHWSPGVLGMQADQALPTPRLFSAPSKARLARGQWVRGIVEWKERKGDGWDSLISDMRQVVRDVGRKTDDLQVVEFDLVETACRPS
jgi:hypothetical protein